MDDAPPGLRFQRLVARIFATHGFKVEEERFVAADDRPRVFTIDLLLT
jgi:hypothetical protein